MSKMKLYDKSCREHICKKSKARSNAETFTRINQIVRGWINYFKIGRMKIFMDKFGQWVRHKIRVIILKQWKESRKIGASLKMLNRKLPYKFNNEWICLVTNSRLGWCK